MKDKAELIKAEIERRKKFYYDRYTKKGVGCIEESRYEECVELLDFINSLPEEPVSEDLEEAAEKYAYENWQSDDYHDGADDGLPFDAIGHTEKCFKAGAQWQKNIDKESISEDLEEVSMSYAQDVIRKGEEELRNQYKERYGLDFGKAIVSPNLNKEIANHFKAGSQWQKERFIKKACRWIKSHGGFTIGFDGATYKEFIEYLEG